MHVEQVNEEEDRLPLVRGEPADGAGDHDRAVAAVADGVRVARLAGIEHLARHGREHAEIERAVVIVEALVEAHAAFQEDAADEGGGAVAALLQDAGRA